MRKKKWRGNILEILQLDTAVPCTAPTLETTKASMQTNAGKTTIIVSISEGIKKTICQRPKRHANSR